MLLKAAEDFNIDLSRSWMIGDGSNDVNAGKAAGCRTVLIGTEDFGQDISAEGLFVAVNQVLEKNDEETEKIPEDVKHITAQRI